MKSLIHHIKQISLLKYLQINVLLFFVSLNSYSVNVDSIYKLGLNYYNNAEYALAIEKLKEAILFKNEIDDSSFISRILHLEGICYHSINDFSNALSSYYKSLNIREELGDKKNIANTLNNIGLIYRTQLEYDEALKIHKRALSLRKEISDSSGMSMSLNNIGSVYESKSEYEKALEIHKKVLQMRLRARDKRYILRSYTSIASMYRALKDYKNAMINYEKALKIQDELGVSDFFTLNQLGFFHNKLGDYKKAIYYSKKSLNDTKNIRDKRDAVLNLSKSYRNLGDYKKSLYMSEIYFQLQDSIHNKKNIKALLEQKTQYEYNKKATIDSIKNAELIKIKQAKLQEQAADIQQDKAVRYGLLIGIFMFLAFLIVTFNRFNISKKMAKTINKQSIRINDSLNYAKKIQQALLPSITEMGKNFNDTFIFYEPKGVISGDFYWHKTYNDKTLIVCADSVGHMAMGGLLSTMGGLVIGNVVQQGFNKPSELLKMINDEVIRLLRQDKDGVIEDGMGMSVCLIDHRSKKIEFSGARNGMILVRDEKVSRFKGSFYFIGGKFEKNGQKIERIYNDDVIDYRENDWLFMYTDGIIEQLGGKKGGPVGYKRFESYISELSNIENSNTKRHYLKSKFDEWRGKEGQLDDLLLMGFKLT